MTTYDVHSKCPVYEEDGSGAHVSWCPCYPCHVERTVYVCSNCGKYARRDTLHACDTEGR